MVSIVDYTGHWLLSPSFNLENSDTSCTNVSSIQIACMSKGLNSSSSISAFTINGTNIQNDADNDIRGNYNFDGTISWYNRTTLHLVWRRPPATNGNGNMEQNDTEQENPLKGKYFP